MAEDLSKWKPIWGISYAGYRAGNKKDEPNREGRVIIHIKNNDYIGGFYIHRSGSVKIWSRNGSVPTFFVPFQQCKFTKRREGNLNIYDVKVNATFGGNMAKEDTELLPERTTAEKEASFWDRIFRTKEVAEWSEIFQEEIDKRWRIFDRTIEELEGTWKKFKETQMGIPEAESNAANLRKEWSESLTSLSNLLTKVQGEEIKLWDITQGNRLNRSMKIKQKIIRTGIDEMNFNNMLDKIETYPKLQASSVVEKALEKLDEKRKEAVDAEKLYNQRLKEVNFYLNTVRSELIKAEKQLDAFGTKKDEGARKMNDELNKPLNRLKVKFWWTPKERQRLQLYLDESDRKIDENRNQLKLIKEDLEAYEKRDFKPIVTKKFAAIEE